MPLGAKLLLAAGIAVTVVVLPALLVVIGHWVSDWTQGMDLRQRDRGLLYALAYLVSVLVALVPAWLSRRYAFSRWRKLVVVCPHCQWSGVCRLGLTAHAVPGFTGKGVISEVASAMAQEYEIEGIPNPEDPVRNKLERLEERRRRKAREAEADAGPNPDFDFGPGKPDT
jgi:hypothetical protein